MLGCPGRDLLVDLAVKILQLLNQLLLFISELVDLSAPIFTHLFEILQEFIQLILVDILVQSQIADDLVVFVEAAVHLVKLVSQVTFELLFPLVGLALQFIHHFFDGFRLGFPLVRDLNLKIADILPHFVLCALELGLDLTDALFQAFANLRVDSFDTTCGVLVQFDFVPTHVHLDFILKLTANSRLLLLDRIDLGIAFGD